MGKKRGWIPLLEVSVGDSAGEALPADPDALQHTVTPQLVDDQEVLHQPCRDVPDVLLGQFISFLGQNSYTLAKVKWLQKIVFCVYHLESWTRWESDNAQSVDECFSSWSSAPPGWPIQTQRRQSSGLLSVKHDTILYFFLLYKYVNFLVTSYFAN